MCVIMAETWGLIDHEKGKCRNHILSKNLTELLSKIENSNQEELIREWYKGWDKAKLLNQK